MAYQPINYAGIEPQGLSGMGGFIDALSKGYQAGQLPQQMQRKRQQEELANAYQQMRNQQEPQRFAADMEGKGLSNQMARFSLQNAPEQERLKRAMMEAKLAEVSRRSDSPYGGQMAPGDIGQAMWLNAIRQQEGEDSPYYQDAKKAFDMMLKKSSSMNQYREKQVETADKRTSSPLSKIEQEIDDAKRGFMPGTGRSQPLSPGQQENILNGLQLQRQKIVSDVDTRKRVHFAENIDKTLQNINVGDLTQYAGAYGSAQKLIEEGKAPFGKESESYRKFNTSLKGANLLKKQIRQFYGDSITPQMQESIEKMTNPATWKNNPVLASEAFNTIKNILLQETQTYKDALRRADSSESPKRLKFNPSTGGFD